MANNRMYLVCNVCLPKGEKYDYDKWVKVSFHVAKWYPGEIGEWYTNATNFNFAESMDKFFEAHAHPDKYPGGVENPVRLDYEWEGTPVLQVDDQGSNAVNSTAESDHGTTQASSSSAPSENKL